MITSTKYTGDFDGLLKHRVIRVLVPFSKTLYFVDKGPQRGLAYDAFTLFAEEVNKRNKKGNILFHAVFVPISRGDVVEALNDGRGDVAMAYLTITPERQKLVDFTNPTATNVSEIVVTAPPSRPVSSPQDLSGREVYIRENSSYYQSIDALNAELKKAGKQPVKVRIAPDNLEAEDILEMVNAGLVPATIADDVRAKFWKQVFTKIELHPEAALRTGAEYGWMIRKNSPLLKKELDAFLARLSRGVVDAQPAPRQVPAEHEVREGRDVDGRAQEVRQRPVASSRNTAASTTWTTLLMAAQGYQESRARPGAKSPVGAVGVMQVMPRRARSCRSATSTRSSPNIHAGVKYVRFMLDKYYATSR